MLINLFFINNSRITSCTYPNVDFNRQLRPLTQYKHKDHERKVPSSGEVRTYLGSGQCFYETSRQVVQTVGTDVGLPYLIVMDSKSILLPYLLRSTDPFYRHYLGTKNGLTEGVPVVVSRCESSSSRVLPSMSVPSL